MIMKIGLLLVIIVLVLAVFKRFSKQDTRAIKEETVDNKPVEMKEDPVCGTFVEEVTKHKVKYYDKVYYFCSDECKQKFIVQKQAENI